MARIERHVDCYGCGVLEPVAVARRFVNYIIATYREQSSIAGQIDKEITHNEALILLDALTDGSLAAGVGAVPPSSPTAGLCYRVGTSATGGWAGMDGKLAISTAGGWRFVTPFEGLQLTEQGSGLAVRYFGGQWESGIERASELRVAGIKVVGARSASIAGPAGGSVVDNEARATVDAILAAMRGHGLIA
ncbi:DUF2793 domain-containing protein [Sphingomonas sp. ASV193]|uniref:DUF2793 domain-containing protein n=1 Tax=Sphingomonas sp. ASV193 TaxID=3144405 RepID=UPI0032E8F67A